MSKSRHSETKTGAASEAREYEMMICESCEHQTVCKFRDAAGEIYDIVDRVAQAADPWRMVPECDEYKAMDTRVKGGEQKWQKTDPCG